MPIDNEKVTGTIDTIVLKETTAELTVTLKSKTGEKEKFEYEIDVWYGGDHGGGIGPFLFDADTNSVTKTALDNEINKYAAVNNYHTASLNFSFYLNFGTISLYNGSLFYSYR